MEQVAAGEALCGQGKSSFEGCVVLRISYTYMVLFRSFTL